MSQDIFENVKTKMTQALTLIKEALDMSIPLLKTEQKNNIGLLWEAFIGEFISYIKHRSKKTGVNLISNISIRRIWSR